MATIGSMKATMSTFAHQIVTTVAMISEADQQMDLLEPSVQFALTLLPLLKAIESMLAALPLVLFIYLFIYLFFLSFFLSLFIYLFNLFIS
jgi:hypothetical protein